MSATTSVDADRVAHLESLIGVQARVLDLVGENAPIDEILRELSKRFQQQIEGSLASIMLAGEDGTTLRVGCAPSLDAAYCKAIDPVLIADESMSCGTAAWRREAVVVQDIATDRRWESARSWALAAGLRACWSVPIIGSGGTVLGTFAAYWQKPTSPGPRDLWVQHHFARLAQVAIERHLTVQRVTRMLADERRQIAGDLHDDPIQAVTAVGLRLQRLARTARPDQQDLLRDAQQTIGYAIERMRHMLFELHPPTLDDEGLESALELYLSETFEPADVSWALHTELDQEPPPELSALAYRVAREALANVSKYAKASNVEVHLERQGNGIRIRVVDDGTGFDPSVAVGHHPGHMGMTNCRYLVRRAAGRWDVRSQPGSGSTVEFWLPMVFR